MAFPFYVYNIAHSAAGCKEKMHVLKGYLAAGPGLLDSPPCLSYYQVVSMYYSLLYSLSVSA